MAGVLARIGNETKSIAHAIKSAGFSAYGGNNGNSYGGSMPGYGMMLNTSLPGSQYEDASAAGVLWHNPTAAACFIALTKAFAQARPYIERRKTKNGDDWQREDHVLIEKIERPNEFYSGERMFGVSLICSMSQGAAFWRFERDGKGEVSEIWYEPPHGLGQTGIAPNWDGEHFIKDYYRFVDGERDEKPIAREDCVYFRHGLDVANPRMPWAPLGLGAREIAVLNGASTYTSAVLRNHGAPAGFVSMDGGGLASATPPTFEQAEALKAHIEAKFGGPQNAGKTFVSPQPWKWNKVGMTPAEMVIDSIRQWPQETVCALLGTPVTVALLPTGAQPTYQNLDASMRWWWDNTIIPLEDAFADEIETQMFPAFGLDAAEYRINWDRSKVPALQEDEQAKLQMWSSTYQAGGVDRFTFKTKIGVEAVEEDKGLYHPSATPGQPQAEPLAPEEIEKQKRLNAAAKSEWELKRFDPNQTRDEDGKWASGSASSATSTAAKKGEMRAATKDEAKALAIPPTYTDVLITDDANAELKATAKSAKGKVQYYYAPEYSQRQAAAKFDRVKELHNALPVMRKTWDAEISGNGKNAHEAMALRLISQTGFRVGGLEGGGDVAAYGASSLQMSHVKVSGDRIEFDFIGKGGHQQQHSLVDPVLAQHIESRKGKETVFDTNDAKVRDYLKRTGGDFKVHDLRTRTASAMAAHYVGSLEKSGNVPQTNKEIAARKNQIADKVATKLGDTRSVVLSSYIAPHVWESWG